MTPVFVAPWFDCGDSAYKMVRVCVICFVSFVYCATLLGVALTSFWLIARPLELLRILQAGIGLSGGWV